jgi:exopolysaccharide production protein ExoZ
LSHVRPLDGLRGIAILLVIVPHIASTGMLPGPSWLTVAAGSLAHGVDLFFVLSGFGLAYPLLAGRFAHKAMRLDLLTYAFNRCYRILPAFYAAIVIAYVAIWLARVCGHFTTSDMLLAPQSLYAALAPLVLFDRANLPVNPNLWTIAVQFRWYAVFPLLMLVWMKSPRAFALLLAAAWAGYLFTRERTIDLGSIPLFMLGIVAAELIVRRHRLLDFAVVLLPVALVAAFAWDPHAVVPDPWNGEIHFVGQPTSLPWQVAAFALVLAAPTVRPICALLSWRPLVTLGTASFSIYLVHLPVIAVVFAIFGKTGGVVALAALLVTGFAFWWCVERPLTNGTRRRAIRQRALPTIERIFAWLGLPQSVTLNVVPDEERGQQRSHEPWHEAAHGIVNAGVRLGDEPDEGRVLQIVP